MPSIIHSIKIENFKGYKDIHRIPLAPITLLYGPNSAGKSSILQSLQLLKQTMRDAGASPADLRPTGDLVDLGSFRSLIFKHEIKRHLGLELTFASRMLRYEGLSATVVDLLRTVGFYFKPLPQEKGKEAEAVLLRTKFGMNQLGQEKPELDVQLQSDGKDTFKFLCEDSLKSLENFISNYGKFKQSDLQHLLGFVNIPCERGLPKGISVPPRIEMASKFAETIVQLKEMDIFGTMSAEVRNILTGISYLGPLRSQPTRQHVSLGGRVNSVGMCGELSAQILLDNLDVLAKLNAEFKAFDIPYELAVRPYQDEVMGTIIVLALKDSRSNVQVSPVDVGFGIGQLLPILIEGLVSKDKIICVEQPEIHLHPRLQAHMADFFIRTAGLGKNPVAQNQWIIETHSEALILRIQRRIREQVISANDISILYVQVGRKKQAGSEVIELPLDEGGCFMTDWPDGFFEESYHELFSEALQ